MTTLSWLRRLFDSVFWADQRALGSLDEADADACRYFHHLLAAERVWLLRLRGESSAGQAIWPDLTADEAREMADANREGYQRYLGGITEAELESVVAYTNQSGQRFRLMVADILTHVALHGAYHRGQIARARRQAGGEPVNTDFFIYVRNLEEQDGTPAPGIRT